jgi:hypothetical protein
VVLPWIHRVFALIAARRSGCEARVNLDEKVSPDA